MYYGLDTPSVNDGKTDVVIECPKCHKYERAEVCAESLAYMTYNPITMRYTDDTPCAKCAA